MEIDHTPVMPAEVLENLLIPPGRSVMIDCTTGEGGHSSLFLSHYPELSVIGIDRDAEIQKKAIERLSAYGDRFTPVLSWFNDYLASAESGSADAILFDLGISMFHYAESGRGFSFRGEEELDCHAGEVSGFDFGHLYGEGLLIDGFEGAVKLEDECVGHVLFLQEGYFGIRWRGDGFHRPAHGVSLYFDVFPFEEHDGECV